MPRSPAGRKFQITINNPLDHGMSHDEIKEQLNSLSSIIYWALCDEIGGEEHTLHTHIYIVANNPIMFSSLKKRFPTAHIEAAKGSNQENYDYIRKQGKWANDAKGETSLPDTFEEQGDLPPDREKSLKDTEAIYNMIKVGATNTEILEAFPSAMNRIDKIERTRQELLKEKYKREFRLLEVVYIYGKSGVGKTRSVLERYGYENVYRVTNYQHPFDGYAGQDVILFDEFRSSLPLADMLKYLEGYPISLPARFSDRQALYNKVYIISNISLELQYTHEHSQEPRSWAAFKRRITQVYELLEGGIKSYPDLPF